jgi:hypothetical protein
MEDLARTLSDMSIQNDGIRTSKETRKIHLDSYLPMESKRDLELFFRVTLFGCRH